MNPWFAQVPPEASIDEAITWLRQQLSQVETIYYAWDQGDASKQDPSDAQSPWKAR